MGFMLRNIGSAAPPAYPSATRWRILVSRSVTGLNVGFAELEMKIANGGADQCSGGTSSASSTLTSYVVGRLFDDSASTFWVSNGFTNEWAEYQFASAKAIKEVTIRARPSYQNDAPLTFYIQYYNGATWQTVYTRTNEPSWAAGELRTYNW